MSPASMSSHDKGCSASSSTLQTPGAKATERKDCESFEGYINRLSLILLKVTIFAGG